MKIFFGGVLLLFITWILSVYHLGSLPPLKNFPTDLQTLNSLATQKGKWFSKETFKLNHLFVSGSPFERGNAEGFFTKDLMIREEKDLNQSLDHIFHSPIIKKTFFIIAMRWFSGVDKFFSKEHMEEMYGISQWASKDFNYLADPFTRQLAYHGVHEIGQMMVDHQKSDFGCTALGIKNSSWIVGRNFDFEGSRILDEEKVIKWVYPEKGFPFVHVTWAGMVGAVTGVNNQGVYISLNAAGSKDYVRYGTPTTLVATKALQESKNAFEAKKIIEEAHTFITDIFLVVDREGNAFQIEKTPKQVHTIELNSNFAITNHLESDEFKNDPTNQMRLEQLTTKERKTRGMELVSNVNDFSVNTLANFLRDKNSLDGTPLHLGNRAAIDPLIATHSVIYDAKNFSFYVNEGPTTIGEYVGFDLQKSFETKEPVSLPSIPRDPTVSLETYSSIYQSTKIFEETQLLLKSKNCDEAKLLLDSAPFKEHNFYYQTLGKAFECKKDFANAHKAYEKALELKPAYSKERDFVKGKL